MLCAGSLPSTGQESASATLSPLLLWWWQWYLCLQSLYTLWHYVKIFKSLPSPTHDDDISPPVTAEKCMKERNKQTNKPMKGEWMPLLPVPNSHCRYHLHVYAHMCVSLTGGDGCPTQGGNKKYPVTIRFSTQVEKKWWPPFQSTAFYACAMPETLSSREERGTVDYLRLFSPLDTKTLQRAVGVFRKGLHCQLQLAAQRSDILSGPLLVTFPHTLAHTKTPVKQHPTYVASRKRKKKKNTLLWNTPTRKGKEMPTDKCTVIGFLLPSNSQIYSSGCRPISVS